MPDQPTVTDLSTCQNALVRSLFEWPPHDATDALLALLEPDGSGQQTRRGLQAYQGNGHFLAERALQAAYPTLQQLVGEESFAALARALWHAHPPTCGDLALWGGALAGFVENEPQLQDTPYLGDVARAEWALHCCASAADRPARLQTLELLTTHDPDRLILQFAAGTCVQRSRWPVASILLAHRVEAAVETHDTTHTASFDKVASALRAGQAEDLVVWRQGFQPQLRQTLPGEFGLLQDLLEEKPLGPSLSRNASVDFAGWLTLAVQSGLLCAVASYD